MPRKQPKSDQEKKAIHKVWNLFVLVNVNIENVLESKLVQLKNSQNQKAVRLQILEGILH